MAFGTAHKFYLSVTNIEYSKKDNALQITTRLFIDDMDRLLLERYGIHAKLGTSEESAVVQEYLETYLREKFSVAVNGNETPFVFLAEQYENDVMVCYLEVNKVSLEEVETIAVRNAVLTDLFEEQQNVVHFKIAGTKKSFVLMKENNKGMLNL